VVLVLGILLVTGVLLPDADKTTKAVERVVKAAEPSTVVVDSGQADGQGSSGTGWVLDAGAGLIVTNAHVVDGLVDLKVGIGGELRKAKLVGISPCEDLAVVRAEKPSGLKALPLGRQSALARGQTVVALGYPADASLETNLTVTTGVVSVTRTSYREATLDLPHFPNVIQTDAAINPGNSGGPLLDLDGRLIGVTSAGRTVTPEGRIIQGQSYAIGVDRVRDVASSLRKGKSIGSLGVSFDYLTPAELRRRNLPPGLLIEEAARGSAAESAGLGGGTSLLVAVDGQPIDNSLASYCDAVQGLRSGKSATVSVLTPGASRPRRVKLPLGSA
jgi:S1-C subfamily serine protease